MSKKHFFSTYMIIAAGLLVSGVIACFIGIGLPKLKKHGENWEARSPTQASNTETESDKHSRHQPQTPSRGEASAKPALPETVSDVQPAIKAEPQLTPEEFVSALRSVVGKNIPDEIRALLEKSSQVHAAEDALKALLADPNSGAALRRYAAEALMRIGTAESVQSVFDQISASYRNGDTDGARALLAAFEAPTTSAGYQAMFDFLLGRGAFAQSQDPRPEEVIAALRKALRTASDRETVGTLATQLYLDPQVVGNNAALTELFDGVSHPVMLAQLAALAYQENLPQNAAQFLDRLRQHDDQSVVQALVQMTSNQAVPLNDAATALYNWSLQHPQQALSGVFLQYITDASLPPAQRSVAAFGLAATADSNAARRFLEKAISSEANTVLRTNLQLALATLNNRQTSSGVTTKP
jgi:tetratricopeptide (TPR) repeat protein